MSFEMKPVQQIAMLNVSVDDSLHLQEESGQVVVSSRYIAERFGKEHKNVLRDIENIIYEGMLKIEPPLFTLTQYQHPQNKQWYPEYLLTKDGFTLLAMGFTGQEALKWKLKYIEAFNQMEKYIREQKPFLEYSEELNEFANVAKIIGLNKKDKLTVVLKLMQKHGVPTLGLEELAACSKPKELVYKQNMDDALSYVCDHNPVGFALKEYYKNYLFHCAENGVKSMEKNSFCKVVRQLGYEGKSKRINGESCKVWFEVG